MLEVRTLIKRKDRHFFFFTIDRKNSNLTNLILMVGQILNLTCERNRDGSSTTTKYMLGKS